MQTAGFSIIIFYDDNNHDNVDDNDADNDDENVLCPTEMVKCKLQVIMTTINDNDGDDDDNYDD